MGGSELKTLFALRPSPGARLNNSRHVGTRAAAARMCHAVGPGEGRACGAGTWVRAARAGDIIVHMEPPGFMQVLACITQQPNIWETILAMAMFFYLRVLNPSKKFESTVVQWKE